MPENGFNDARLGEIFGVIKPPSSKPPPDSGNGGGGGSTPTASQIAGAVTGGIAFILLLFALHVYIRRRRGTRQDNKANEDYGPVFVEAAGSHDPAEIFSGEGVFELSVLRQTAELDAQNVEQHTSGANDNCQGHQAFNRYQR